MCSGNYLSGMRVRRLAQVTLWACRSLPTGGKRYFLVGPPPDGSLPKKRKEGLSMKVRLLVKTEARKTLRCREYPHDVASRPPELGHLETPFVFQTQTEVQSGEATFVVAFGLFTDALAAVAEDRRRIRGVPDSDVITEWRQEIPC